MWSEDEVEEDRDDLVFVGGGEGDVGLGVEGQTFRELRTEKGRTVGRRE